VPLSQAMLMEKVTGELYQRFVRDNAEKMHVWASNSPWVSIGLFDFRSAMEWALHFEKVVPKLHQMIDVLTVFTYTDNDEDVILFRVLEYGRIESSSSRATTEHRRLYEAEARVSHLLIDRADTETLAWVRDEIEGTLAVGLADMFEKYLAEGMFPLVPIPTKAMTG
jgi:hypothetical protein